MKILEGGLKKFCQHTDLSFNSDAPVVGLFAENGAGKSNFLAAINYLFTGELELSKERYIQNYDPEAVGEDGKKLKWRAEAWCRFQQGGEEGRIERWITPTTAGRKLNWGGKEYTKAADVDSMLEEILGADRKAISSAVFIAQGELESLLFGSLGDREKLFVKFLNLGHLDKVAKAAESRAKLLMGQVEDLTAQKDEIMLSIQAAARAHDEEIKKLDSTPDFSKLLTKLRCISADSASVSRERASVMNLARRLSDEKSSLKTYMAQEDVTSVADLQASLDETKALGTQLREDLNKAQAAARAYERLEAHRNAVETVMATKQEIVQANSIRPERSAEDLKVADERIGGLVVLSASFLKKKDALTTAESRLSEMNISQLKPTDDLEVWIETAAAERHTKTEHLRVLEAAASGGSDEGSCPVCGSDIGEHLLSEENLDKIRGEIATSGEALSAKRLELRECREANKGIEHTRSILTDEVARLKEEIAAIDLDLQDRDHDQLLAQLNEIRELAQLHEKADKAVGNLPGILQAQEATEANLKAAVRPEDVVDSKIHNSAMLPLYQQRIDEALEKYRKTESVQTRVMSLEDKIADVDSELKIADAKFAEMTSRLESSIAELEKKIADRLLEDIDVVPDVIAEYETLHSARSTQEGIVQARYSSLKEAKERLAELEDRESKDALRRGIAESMKRFKDAFSRTGLPKTFIRYRFDQLAALTQENLASMEANFSVFPSDDAELSFDFARVDDVTNYVMHQDQLSGGQRVALSIAFLLAVQQLVVPDIGFLVLDEPSLHLDEKSRNDLKDLLVGLSEQLRNSEAQVFVVDHSPDLRPAFQRLIQLKK